MPIEHLLARGVHEQLQRYRLVGLDSLEPSSLVKADECLSLGSDPRDDVPTGRCIHGEGLWQFPGYDTMPFSGAD